METILIATDFSAAARTATLYGFELAKSINAKVVLFTSYQASTADPQTPVYITPDDNERLHFKKLMEEAETLDPNRTVALETECYSGPVTDAILSVAVEKGASYIIVGMKGRGKELRKLFGSTVTDLFKKSTIPLIVVPEDAIFSVPKTIALARDINDESDLHVLEPLRKIACFFNSRLFIVRVIKKAMNEAVERLMKSERLNWFLSCLQYSYEFPKNDNVAKALTAFVQKNAVDMVVVIPHEHTLMEKLFTRSVTKDLVFHTNVPLLILPSHTLAKVEAAEEDVSVEFQLAF